MSLFTVDEARKAYKATGCTPMAHIVGFGKPPRDTACCVLGAMYRFKTGQSPVHFEDLNNALGLQDEEINDIAVGFDDRYRFNESPATLLGVACRKALL